VISLMKNPTAITVITNLLRCATVDLDYPKEESIGLQPADIADTFNSRPTVS
jgi:hypothetical protein